jgi:hypothetical protein
VKFLSSLSSRGRWITAWLALFGLVSVTRALPAPINNEWVYLIGVYRRRNPGFLSADWSIRHSSFHELFNVTVGTLSGMFSLPAIAYAGRLLCWAAILWLLLRIATRYGLHAGTALLAIGLWTLSSEPALYGNEWVFLDFEAKVLAYVALFAAIERLLSGSYRVAGLLVGMTSAWHPSVGFSACAGLGVAMLLVQIPWRRRIETLTIAAVLSIAGVLPTLRAVAGEGASDDRLWRLQVEVVTPFHLDVMPMPNVAVLLSFAVLAFNLAALLWEQRSRPVPDGMRAIAGLQIGMAVVVIGGIAAHAMGEYALLKTYPYRVFPILIPLFFLLHAARVWELSTGEEPRRASRPLAVAALIGLLLLGSPLHHLRAHLSAVRSEWNRRTNPDDELRAFAWIAGNTPPNATVVLPPWRKEVWLVSRRATIANLHFVAVEHLEAWTERMQALLGPLDAFVDIPDEQKTAAFRRAYFGMSDARVQELRVRYGADYLVSRPGRALPIVYESGAIAVYDLRGLPTAPTSSGTR